MVLKKLRMSERERKWHMADVKLTYHFMMDDALEEEDYEFEYEDDYDEHEGDADAENKYYNAKGMFSSRRQLTAAMKSNDPVTALRELQNIVDQDTPQTEW